jgi:hypothetical protein
VVNFTTAAVVAVVTMVAADVDIATIVTHVKHAEVMTNLLSVN